MALSGTDSMDTTHGNVCVAILAAAFFPVSNGFPPPVHNLAHELEERGRYAPPDQCHSRGASCSAKKHKCTTFGYLMMA